MIYEAEITTPANTLATNPLVTRLTITKGLVYKIEFYMPHGAMALHYLQIYDGPYQIWPTTPGRSFRGDGLQVAFDDLYLKSAKPYEFQIKTWNLDETYEHTVWVYIGLVSEEAFMMRFLPGLTYDKMVEALAKIEAQQNEARAAVLAQPVDWISG